MYEFTLAGLTFRLKTPHEILVTENFRPFQRGGGMIVPVSITETAELPELSGRPAFSNLSFSVFAGEGGWIRRFHDHREGDRPYAVCRMEGGGAVVEYLSGDRQFFAESHNCFSHIGLEELLIRHDRLILHAAYVDTPMGAVLFSGPSGIGKSTQADLWVRYAGAELINGDRTILSRETDSWIAHGSPYAGSSRCFVDRSRPVRAVVMLEQGESCRLRRLGTGEAFRKLYAGTTVNSWDSRAVERTSALLADLAAGTEVLHLTCTPDRSAVELLEKHLRKEE